MTRPMDPEIAAALEAAPDPKRARQALERIRSAWRDTDQPVLEEALLDLAEGLPAFLHLLSISPISAEKIVRDPRALRWLAAPKHWGHRRGQNQMRAALARLGWDRNAILSAPKPATFLSLRRWKQREMLRIALRDVAGLALVEETTRELTDLAEICVQEVCAVWHRDHVRRLGEPGTGYAVFAMGKFGGLDLNFSSDIDVVFVYGEPGELAAGLTRQEFHARFAQKVIETFAASDASGALFRIDMRLRPEGDGGPLVRSLDSMENYYAAFGETWERMALSKARQVAGDPEIGYEFFQRLQSFIYPRAVGPEMIDEIARIKGRIEQERASGSRLQRDVKLGRGGIREVEFVCQALQLLHGAKHAFLQERQTLRALNALRELGLLSVGDAVVLRDSYRFLRMVEHRLQIENEAQTHTIPEEKSALCRLARSLGFGAHGQAQDAAEAFAVALIRHMENTRSVFERVMQAREEKEAAPPDLSFFSDAAAGAKNLADMGGGGGSALISPRTKQLFARLEPALLQALRGVADPDSALRRLVRFTERYGSRGAFFETLLVNPRVLELFAKLFDASEFLSEIAIQRPQLVEEVARLGNLGERRSAADHLRGLARNDEGLPWPAWVRVYRRAQQLRIGLRDLLEFATLPEVWAECSAVAEACMLFVAEQLGLRDLTIVALGKFGGSELGYGADLDVLFIGGDVAGAARLAREMSERTADGRIFPVDARLRPEGESGQLAVTLGEWQSYFERGRGELWEAQALTKARPIAGPQQTEWLAAAQKIWREHGQRPDLREQIKAMLQRIAEHRGSDPLLDFKTGPGGLMQLEFYVQARQMTAGHWEPNTLAALGHVAPTESVLALRDAYLALRKVETVLRRNQNAPISSLPSAPEVQQRLAKRCGYASTGGLLAAVQRARETIARLARL